MLTLFSGEYGTRDTVRFIEEKLETGLWSWDLATNVMEWSRGMFSLLGLQPDAVSPHFDVLADMIHPDDRRPPGEPRPVFAGMPADRKFRIVWRNGRVRWVHNKGEALLGPDGSATRAIGLMRDVTALQETLRKLQLSDKRLHALTVTVGAPVWTANVDGSITVVENWTQLRADGVDDVLGKAWIDLVHPDDRAATLKAWDNARARRDRYEVEHRVRQMDGSYRWHLSRGMPVEFDRRSG